MTRAQADELHDIVKVSELPEVERDRLHGVIENAHKLFVKEQGKSGPHAHEFDAFGTCRGCGKRK